MEIAAARAKGIAIRVRGTGHQLDEAATGTKAAPVAVTKTTKVVTLKNIPNSLQILLIQITQRFGLMI